MKQILLVAVVLLACILGAGVIAGGLFMFALAGSFGTSAKLPIQEVGAMTDGDVRQAYGFVSSATGLSFPNRTSVNLCDDGWGKAVGCFSIPPAEIDAFLARNALVPAPSPTPVEPSFFADLSADNRDVPNTAIQHALKAPPAWDYPILIYFDKRTGKLWVECNYRPPYD
jgi:hypothetical protein